MRVSVVVPTHHRNALLQRCLSALLSQDLNPNCYEILVIDDGRSTETEYLVTLCALNTPIQVRYLRPGNTRGPAAARNAGWRAAEGEIIAFTDDDCVPNSDWLKHGLSAFVPGVDAVFGRVVVPLPSRPTDYERNASRLQYAGFVTANCFCRRTALEAAGGFDERFRLAWREDSDLFFTLIELQRRCVQEPRAIVIHPIRPARWAVSLAQQRRAMYNALLYKKHQRLYRKYIQRNPPWLYYLSAFALLAWIGAWIAGAAATAAAAATAWLLATFIFFLKRLAFTSKAPSHIAEMALTSALIPLLAIFWRLRGAVRYRVPFL
ncbi:MAG: glycosyltransferase [Bryobacteraceae bacterium]|jgi:Glycosyltransferases, probably involved in cell wall biogenesis|nr:glycosyltransferase [Bryobacteraceae bacterium]